MGALRIGAAVRGADGTRLGCGSTLGCVAYRHAGVRFPRTPTRCSSLVTKDAARGVTAAASTTPAPTRTTPTGLRGRRTATACTRT
jgi:hypothetical protein